MSPSVTEVDLLIIGAGPAGLMAAAWASRCKLNARIIDDKDSRVVTGQADGLHCRTLEIFDSFGIANEILQQACVIKEIASWNPKSDNEEHIERTETVRSGEEDLSRYPQVSLSQGGVEQAFLNFLERDGPLRVERNLTPDKISLDDAKLNDQNAFPVEVHLRQLGQEERAGSPDPSRPKGNIKEIVRAKYVLGTEGAHSWTRKAMGIQMEGDRTNKHFGVMDFIPLSDFPDIRISSAIHSKAGSIMTLPREKSLVRFYVQLAETEAEGGDFDRSKVGPDDIIKTARKILSPYKLDYGHCDWFSIYTVAQRLATSFSHQDRVFLAGDAVHTHSPTMGAGMNVSMQDSYNLVWKIATAIRTGNPEILSTYNLERYEIAKDLIDKDRQMSSFYCQGPSADSKQYQEFRNKFRDFVSGVAVGYGPNMLVASADDAQSKEDNDSSAFNTRKDSQQSLHECRAKAHLAPGIKLGQRIPAPYMTNHFTAEVDHLHKALKSDGRWRLLIFAGNLADPHRFSMLKETGQRLEAPDSFIRHLTPETQAIDSIIDILTIHSSPRHSVAGLELPNIFHPWDDTSGWDYWKIFANYVQDMNQDIYDEFGIDKEKGCLVVCRPDQHVGFIGALEDVDAVGGYLERILKTV